VTEQAWQLFALGLLFAMWLVLLSEMLFGVLKFIRQWLLSH
jgi:hypothetical protein